MKVLVYFIMFVICEIIKATYSTQQAYVVVFPKVVCGSKAVRVQ